MKVMGIRLFKKSTAIVISIIIVFTSANFAIAKDVKPNKDSVKDIQAKDASTKNEVIVDDKEIKGVPMSSSISKGTFNVIDENNKSTIKIMEADTTNVPEYLMPQQSYDIKAAVTSIDGIANLDSLEVKMWLDTSGNQTKESYFNDVKYFDGAISARIIWNKKDNKVIFDAGEDTTWSLQTKKCVLPDEEELSDNSLKNFEFIFRITIGKVARMTEGDSIWMLAYQGASKSGTVYDYYSSNDKVGLKMDWYCEVEAPKNIGWGDICPGVSYEDANAKQRVTGVRYISNGNFNEQVKFDADWKGNEEKRVAKLTIDPVNRNEFALKVNTTDDIKSAKQIPVDGSFVTVSEKSVPTTSKGILKDEYYFYIKLNKNFDMGMYSGNITFGVSNEL